MNFHWSFGASEIGKALVLLNGTKLPVFEAFDDDAGIFGDVSFTLDLDTENLFEFQKIDRKSSELRLKAAVEEKVYEVNL